MIDQLFADMPEQFHVKKQSLFERTLNSGEPVKLSSEVVEIGEGTFAEAEFQRPVMLFIGIDKIGDPCQQFGIGATDAKAGQLQIGPQLGSREHIPFRSEVIELVNHLAAGTAGGLFVVKFFVVLFR